MDAEPPYAEMEHQELARLLRAGEPVTVVDVRDSDRAGGHVKGSLHIPAADFTENAKRYAEEFKGRKVVFHCMFSQVRGPTCAGALTRAAKSVRADERPVAFVLVGGFRSLAAERARYEDIIEGMK